MCFPQGSVEQLTGICKLCRLSTNRSSQPSLSSCPHSVALCKNRHNHPWFDVVYFRAADLDLFSACGYCKWARRSQRSQSDKPRPNTGYPGCCRPPRPSEYHLIKTAQEWNAVHVLYATPIPPEFQPLPSRTSQASPTLRHQKRSPTSSVALPDKDGSPPASAIECDNARTPQRKPHRTSPPSSEAAMARTPPSKPATPAADRQMTPPARTSPKPTAKWTRSTISSSTHPDVPGTNVIAPAPTPARARLAPLASRSSASSNSSHSAFGSATTVTSGEGFTDYLSDESDEELQRQAETKVAELEFAVQEMADFDAALRSVRHLCLHPPPEWTIGQTHAPAHGSHSRAASNPGSTGDGHGGMRVFHQGSMLQAISLGHGHGQ